MTPMRYPDKPRTPPRPSLFRHPPRPAPQAGDTADRSYVVELTAVDTLGAPVAGVELSAVNNNNGAPSSRYTDGNGYTNHTIIGRPDDLITIQTNGAKIVAATGSPTVGPQYFYLPDADHVAIQLSLESFKSGLRPVAPIARGPLPPFTAPINYRTVLPWTPPTNDRNFLRMDAWGVVMDGAPVVPGASTRHPERILSWFLDRYTKDFQEQYLTKYAGYGYTHFKLSLADSMGKIDNGPNSPPGNGRTLDQFIETCLLVKKYVPYCQVNLGSKYFADFEGRTKTNCPNYMTADQWAEWSDPLIDALIKAKAIDELILGWEFNLWNTPGETTINAQRHAGQRAHAAGLSAWLHFGPHVTSWFADGDPRGRFGFYDDLANDVDGINYQTMGAYWSHQMMQARIVDTLWQFGGRGNDYLFRMEEDYATFQWDNDAVTVEQDEIPGNVVTVPVTPDDANLRGFLACCTIDDVDHTDAKVWGYGNGGRRPDGSRL